MKFILVQAILFFFGYCAGNTASPSPLEIASLGETDELLAECFKRRCDPSEPEQCWKHFEECAASSHLTNEDFDWIIEYDVWARAVQEEDGIEGVAAAAAFCRIGKHQYSGIGEYVCPLVLKLSSQ